MKRLFSNTSILKKKADGMCAGNTRVLNTESKEKIHIVHDPEANRFALSNESCLEIRCGTDTTCIEIDFGEISVG